MRLVCRRQFSRTFCVRSRQSIQQLHEARLIRITHGRFAVWLHPFGMLEPQVVVNLSPKLGVRVDLVKHGYSLFERFRDAAGGFFQSLGGMFDQRWRRDYAQTAKSARLNRPDGHFCCAPDAELIRSLFGADVATILPAVRFASESELMMERRFFSFS
jgi:hypothetical protein